MLDFNLHLWENIETISFCRKLNTLMVYKSISQINPPQQVFVNQPIFLLKAANKQMRNLLQIRTTAAPQPLSIPNPNNSDARSVYSHAVPPQSPLRQRRRARTMIRQSNPKLPDPKSLAQLQSDISNTYHKIVNMVDHMQQILQEKLNTHELELLKVFRYTMERITGELQGIVEHYNKVVAEVRVDRRLVDLENQMVFFREQALKLFEENREFREEIKRLKGMLNRQRDQGEIKDGTVVDLTRKLFRLRNSFKRAKMLTLPTQPNETLKLSENVKISLSNFARSTDRKNTRYNSTHRKDLNSDSFWNKF